MLPDRVSNPGPLTYESGALPIALCGPAAFCRDSPSYLGLSRLSEVFWSLLRLSGSTKKENASCRDLPG